MSERSTSTSRDRLAGLVMRRVKRSSSSGGFSQMSPMPGGDDELHSVIRQQLDAKARASSVVSQLSQNPRSSSKISFASPPVEHHPRATSELSTTSAASTKIKNLQAPPRLKIAATPHIPVRGDKGELEDDLWATIAKQKDAELVDIRAHAKAVHAAKLREQKAILDEQCAIRKRRRAEERQAHLAERSVVDSQKVQWDQQRRDTSNQLRTIAVQIKQDREEQVADREVRREKLEQERKDIDRRILERMQRELVEEKERENEAKVRAVKHREELIAANEVQKKIVAERKEVEVALEKEYAIKFNEQVEKQDRERKKAFLELKEKMKGREAMALALQATIDEKAAADEARAEKVTEARYQAQIAKEKAAEEKKKQALEVILEFRAKQLEIKKQRREEEKLHLLAEKEDAEQEVRESIKVLKARKDQQRKKIADTKRMITEQIKDNQEFHPVRMSEEERNLNKGILTRATTGSPANYRGVASPI